MRYFYSPSKNEWFVEGIHSLDSIPSDSIEVPQKERDAIFEKASKMPGCAIFPSKEGNPEVREIEFSFTADQVEDFRLRSYSDPVSGSDRYFSEALRLEALGEKELAEKCKAKGIEKYNEIKAKFPWPSN